MEGLISGLWFGGRVRLEKLGVGQSKAERWRDIGSHIEIMTYHDNATANAIPQQHSVITSLYFKPSSQNP